MKIEFEIESTFPPVGFDFIEQMRLLVQYSSMFNKTEHAEKLNVATPRGGDK